MTANRTANSVCQVLYSGLGGHGSVVFSLIAADKEHYFRHSLLFYGIEPVRGRYVQDAEKYDLPYTAILKKRGPDLRSWIRVYKTLKKDRPETVLLHSTNLIFPVAWYCRRTSAKLIAIEHTPNAVKRKSEHLFSKWCRKLAAKVVVLSEEYKQEYLQQYGRKNEGKLTVIGNGIDIDFYRQPKDRDDPSGKRTVSMIARFSAQKDQLTLIRAIQLLNRENVRLKLAGSGETLETCAAYIRAQGLEEQVELCGLLNEQEILQLFNQTDIYVHSSLGETMPTALMQAMSCQLAVIGSDIPGINNLLEHGVTGLLAEKGNAAEFARLIAQLIDDDGQSSRLGRAARLKAEAGFSNTRMFQNYRQLIETL
jgi:glycosyltransferase involved in cell wall biosynthesis